ncbi:MAG: hypothetical protein PHI84_20210 [Kiritimatiellae bacterium]|nr:hypothetical protein [Kiritimatiellia bacterium]
MKEMTKLLKFLHRLDDCKIHYRIEHNRDDSIMVITDVPGQKWEIEFFPNGNVEIEIFKSDGEIRDESELERFFKEFKD